MLKEELEGLINAYYAEWLKNNDPMKEDFLSNIKNIMPSMLNSGYSVHLHAKTNTYFIVQI